MIQYKHTTRSQACIKRSPHAHEHTHESVSPDSPTPPPSSSLTCPPFSETSCPPFTQSTAAHMQVKTTNGQPGQRGEALHLPSAPWWAGCQRGPGPSPQGGHSCGPGGAECCLATELPGAVGDWDWAAFASARPASSSWCWCAHHSSCRPGQISNTHRHQKLHSAVLFTLLANQQHMQASKTAQCCFIHIAGKPTTYVGIKNCTVLFYSHSWQTSNIHRHKELHSCFLHSWQTKNIPMHVSKTAQLSFSHSCLEVSSHFNAQTTP